MSAYVPRISVTIDIHLIFHVVLWADGLNTGMKYVYVFLFPRYAVIQSSTRGRMYTWSYCLFYSSFCHVYYYLCSTVICVGYYSTPTRMIPVSRETRTSGNARGDAIKLSISSHQSSPFSLYVTCPSGLHSCGTHLGTSTLSIA